MAVDDVGTALATRVAPTSIAKRTLIRAFESHVVAKEQEDDGQRDDRQAPMTLLRNPDGTARKVLIVTTDRAFAEELHEAVNRRLPVSVQLHHAPSDDELEELSRQLPSAQPPPAALPSAPDTHAKEDAELESAVDEAMRTAPPGLSREKLRDGVREGLSRLRARGSLDGKTSSTFKPVQIDGRSRHPHLTDPSKVAASSAPPAPVVTVEATTVEVVRAQVVAEEPSRDSWTDDAPFMLAIRKGRTTLHMVGPFVTVTQAWHAMQERGGPGRSATIYERRSVAQYRGGRATFETGPRSSTWKRVG